MYVLKNVPGMGYQFMQRLRKALNLERVATQWTWAWLISRNTKLAIFHHRPPRAHSLEHLFC